MLVIMSCWDELPPERLPLPERVGKMLKHAGVSITITSFTDVIAFIIGASTVSFKSSILNVNIKLKSDIFQILPCLESYCIYAAVGVLMTFIFVITFFVACFVLDQQRVESNRNGIIPCIEHRSYKPNPWSQSRFTSRVFEYVYKNVILTNPGKASSFCQG